MIITNQTKAGEVKLGDTSLFTQYKSDSVWGTVILVENTESGKRIKIRFEYTDKDGDKRNPFYTLSPNTKMFS